MKTLERPTIVEEGLSAQTEKVKEEMQPIVAEDVPNGEISATFLAAGSACFTMGLITTLSEVSADIANALKLSNAVGPLSGKVAITLVVWLVVWVALVYTLKGKQLDFTRVLIATRS